MRKPSLTCFLLLVSLGLQPLASQAADRKQPSPETISLLPASVELQIGQSQRLLVSARFSNHADADWTRSATYMSSDEQVATIDSDGIARAVAAGRAMITATVGKYQATLPLQVLDQHFPVVPNSRPMWWLLSAGVDVTRGPATVHPREREASFSACEALIHPLILLHLHEQNLAAG